MIDVNGFYGAFTIGKLPDGIDNSSLTWVPVRFYKPEDGGLDPPTFAPGESQILPSYLVVHVFSPAAGKFLSMALCSMANNYQLLLCSDLVRLFLLL